VLSDEVIDVHVEYENDDKQLIWLFDDDKVVPVEAAAATLFADRVSVTIKYTMLNEWRIIVSVLVYLPTIVLLNSSVLLLCNIVTSIAV